MRTAPRWLNYFLSVIFLLALSTTLVFADTRSSTNYTVTATIGQSTPNVIGTLANYQITDGFQQFIKTINL